MFQKLLSLVLLIAGTPIQAVLTGSLTVAPSTVSVAGKYTFEINLVTPIPDAGYMVLTFDSNVNLLATADASGYLACTGTYGLSLPASIKCQATTATTLKITGAFKTTEFLVIFSLTKVTNPTFVSSFFINANSYTSANAMLETSNSYIYTTTPSAIVTTLTNLGSDVAGAYTDLQIEFSVTDQVAKEGSFELTFPKWNEGTQTISLAESMFQYATSDWSASRQGYKIPCASTDHPLLECILKVQKPVSVAEIVTKRDTLAVVGFSSNILALTKLTFKTSGSRFRNPPSLRPIAQFSVSSLINTGNVVGQQTKGISYKINTAATINAADVSITSGSQEINKATTFVFDVTTSLPIPVGATIKIGIPSSIRLFSDDAKTRLILNSVQSFNPLGNPFVTVLDTSAQLVWVQNLVLSASDYVDSDRHVLFNLLEMLNPESIQVTDSFTLSFYDDEYLISVLSGGVFYESTPGQLQSLTVYPESYRVRERVPYSFNFVTTNGVMANGQIGITVPLQITVDASVLAFKSISSVSNAVTITYDSTARLIVIKNAFSSDFNVPIMAEFVITKGLINAESTDPIDPFQVATLDQFGMTIDKGSSQVLTFSANEIYDIVVTACTDKQFASQTEDICTYRLKFVIGADYPVLSGSTIEIELPADLNLASVSTTTTSSYTEGIADLSTLFAVSTNKRTISVLNAFDPTKAPNGVDWRKDSFFVFIAGIMSPRSTAPTLSFKAKIKDASGFLEYQKLQGVYSNVYEAKAFTKAIIKRTNETNGISAAYNFTLQLSSRVYKNEYVKITPPDQVIITPTQNQCLGIKLLSEVLPCVPKGKSMYVMIVPEDLSKDYFEAGEIIAFQVKNIQNPDDFAPTPSFQIFVSSSLHQDYFVNQMVQGISILNTWEGAMTNVQVLPDSNQLGVTTDYSIYFTPANEIPKNSTVEVTFPPKQFTDLLRVTCVAIKNIDTNLKCTVSQNVVTITGGFKNKPVNEGDEVGFKLRNVKNPSESVNQTVISSQFRIVSETSDGYHIDSTYNLNFTIGCTYPCKSCTAEKTTCTSCAATLGPLAQSLVLFENQCEVSCPSGFYADNMHACQECGLYCDRCEFDANKCDTCKTIMGRPYVYDATGECFDRCPSWTYKSDATKSCEECVGNCETCESQNQCLSCKDSFFFYESQCLQTCPETSIQFVSDAYLECQKCQEPCFTCNNTVSECTSCLDGFLFNSKCVTECPATYLPDQFNTCYLASEPTWPFISLCGTALILLLVCLSKCCHSGTKPARSFLALESAYLTLFWIYWTYFLYKDGHKASGALVITALCANLIVNLIWYDFYKTRIGKGDLKFSDFKKKHCFAVWLTVTLSVILSFQLFRILVSELFGLSVFSAELTYRQKYLKRMNRYALFQITFVFTPTVVSAAYNLFYTWYGRQVFWIDIEALVVILFMLITIIFVIFLTEKEYLNKLLHFDLDVIDVDGAIKRKAKRQDVYLVNVGAAAEEIAEDIDQLGFDNKTHKERIRTLNQEQRIGILQALTTKMFGPNGPTRPTHEELQFKVKHGRDEQQVPPHLVNKMKGLSGNNDKSGYSSNGYASAGATDKPSAFAKMFNSITGGGKKEERKVGSPRKDDYMQFDATGLTQLNETTPRLLNNTGDRSEINITDINQLETTHRVDLSNTGKKGGRDGNVFDDTDKDIGLHLRKKSDEANRRDVEVESFQSDHIVDDPELHNWNSAPQNAHSALRGNKALKERHDALLNELNRKRRRSSDRSAATANAHTRQPWKSQKQGGRVQPITEDGPSEQFGAKNKDTGFMSQLRQAAQELDEIKQSSFEDSDSVREYNSEKFGPGTSKAVANHYMSTQNRNAARLRKDSKSSIRSKERSQTPDAIRPGHLSRKEFNELSAELKKLREEKQVVKADCEVVARQKEEQQQKFQARKAEADELHRILKEIEDQIAAELERLRLVKEQKDRDLQFVENAFYTSNEEGMGVSPNAYVSQNRMPRPGTKAKSKSSAVNISVDNADQRSLRRSQDARSKGLSAILIGRGEKSSAGSINNVSPRNVKIGRPNRHSSESEGNRRITTENPPYASSSNISNKDMKVISKRKKGTVSPNRMLLRNTSEGFLPGNRVASMPSSRKQSYVKNRTAGPRGFRENITSTEQTDEERTRNKKSHKKGKKDNSVSARSLPDHGVRGYQGRQGYYVNLENLPEDAFEYFTEQDEDGQFIQRRRLKPQYAPKGENQHQFSLKRFDKSGNPNSFTGRAGNTDVSGFHSDTDNSGPARNRPTITPNFPETMTNRAKGTNPLADSGQMIVEGGKNHKKKKPKAPRDYSGAYFKLTNFERAVIATEGRAPYNNKEVEVISKKGGFDPNRHQFKNNWVNNVIRNSVSSQKQSLEKTPPGLKNSVSNVATTIFQGVNPHGSVLDTDFKAGYGHREESKDRPLTGHTINQMLNASPMTLIKHSERNHTVENDDGSLTLVTDVRDALQMSGANITSEGDQIAQTRDEAALNPDQNKLSYDMPGDRYLGHLDSLLQSESGQSDQQ